MALKMNPGSARLAQPAQESYARYRAKGMKQVDARKLCRISKNTAGRWEKKPAIKARIRFLVDKELGNLYGEQTREIRRITFGSNDILLALADVAFGPLMPASARVTAASKLADIFCLVPRSLKDVKEFYGWTEEELAEFRRTNGEFVPERFRHLIGPEDIGRFEEPETGEEKTPRR